ncbi:uncharacterized protein LOC135207210 isoform X3 [Macrobrachium nipponense]|uniref:uncharacterized protein LOC135207210 isoform X3 n=1 Tax=Macrobrachium nipponense TaxID=159736 RepID=UPI0030C881F4
MGGGARGPSSIRGSSPGLRVTWDDRSTQSPLLHQYPHQPLLLQQHHFLPPAPAPAQQQQQQTPSDRAAAAGAGPPVSGVVGGGGIYPAPTHTAAPPSPAPSSPAHPDSQPKKVTVTSFNQPKLRPVVTQHSGPPTPVLEERKRPPSPEKPQPLAPEENPPPSAPPKDLLDADSDKRREQKGRPHPHHFPPRRTATATADADDYTFDSERKAPPPQDPLFSVPKVVLQREAERESASQLSVRPRETSTPISHPEEPQGEQYHPHLHHQHQHHHHHHNRREKSSRESSGDRREKEKPPQTASGGVKDGDPNRDDGSKSVAIWRGTTGGVGGQPTAGGGAKPGGRGTPSGGSLVWINLPGGGSKLEWMPTPALVTIKSTPAIPGQDPRNHVHQSQQQQQKGQNAVSPGTREGDKDRGGGGGGGGATGGGETSGPTSGEQQQHASRAISCVPRVGDDGGGGGPVPRIVHHQATSTHPTPPPSTTHVQGVLKRPGGSPYTPKREQPKNGVGSAPGATTADPEGRCGGEEEGTVLTVAGKTSGQVVRIRVRPEVHAYLTGLPTAYVAASIKSATASSGRRDSHQDSQSSSGSALTGGSDGGGEGSTGYHEHDYEEVVDEYTLLRRAVDDHDPEAMRLLAAAEAAINPDIPARPHDPEGGGGSEYPYLREMKERLLLSRDPPLASMDESSPHDAHDNQMLEVHQTPVGTVVKLNADGYGSHTSPTHRVESYYTGTLESRRGLEFYPKNAKTSTFITLSLLYATLLVVVCLGFVLSEVLTHNVPLYYYEAFFTYLYGISILFLLYVLCYLLSDSARDRKPKKPQVFMGHHSGQYNVSEYEYYAYNEKVRQTEGIPDGSPTQEKLTSSTCSKPKKHKTSDNEHSHGSFFLRIGAIAFGLGTMIYNGLEFGVFFEIPMVSPCYQILRGVNPLLQLVFTFMQMYFIFMNARLNIHKFKFLARFGLMHIVATNLCVWVRTLVRESLKEINEFKVAQGQKGEDYMILEGIRRALANRGLMAPNRYLYNLDEFVEMQEINETLQQADTTGLMTEEDIVNRTCERVEIMGSIVSDSAPYLYPFIVEYSLIGASVLYIMWKHIGRNPSEIVHSRFVYDPEVAGDGISVASRRCHSRVDCVGASKGLFCGLLVLVASLICLILFFVLVNRDELRMLAIYLADCSHCGIMFFSIIAIFIGFVRVRQLKFHGEREEELDDILLMVSAFGLFAYAVFSSVAGSLSAYTKEPNLLVMVTGILSVLQVIIQMVFIKDTQRRQVSLPEHERTKPGRQVVTFLLICNLTMWVIYTFETQKVEANPVQLEFFGELPWTILLRCTLPLAIFHRFHSTVVLAAIWKNSYKTRIE